MLDKPETTCYLLIDFLMVLINKDNYICQFVSFIKYAIIKHCIISIAYFINYIKTTTKKHSNKTQRVYFVIMTSWHGLQNKLINGLLILNNCTVRGLLKNKV